MAPVLRKSPCDTHLHAICNITASLKIRMFADFRRGGGCWSIKRRDDRRRMRSENFVWFRELGADSGKTPNSLLKSSKIFATSSRREWRSSNILFPERKFASVRCPA